MTDEHNYLIRLIVSQIVRITVQQCIRKYAETYNCIQRTPSCTPENLERNYFALVAMGTHTNTYA